MGQHNEGKQCTRNAALSEGTLAATALMLGDVPCDWCTSSQSHQHNTAGALNNLPALSLISQ